MALVLPQGKQQFFTTAGAPAVGYKLLTLVPGTSTPKDTYTTYLGNVANTNPVVMDSRGEAAIYWVGSYDATLKTDADVTVWGPERIENAASTLQDDLDNSADENKGANLVGFDVVLNYDPGSVGAALQDRRICVTDEPFLAIGDGVTNDHDAVQAAIDHAESLIGTNAYDDTGVEIYFPPGKYLLSSEVTVTKSGIGLCGPVGRGAQIRGNSILFNIGDYTNTTRLRQNTLSWLNFFSTSATNTTAAVKAYRPIETRVFNCTFSGFDIFIDWYRASNPDIDHCRFSASGRTAQATAAMRFQGTDETVTTGTTYTPGGGVHLTNCEFDGVGTGVDTTSGLLLMSFDGLYMTQCHFDNYVRELDVAPDATAANHTTIDLQAVNCYFDNPSTLSTSHCIKLGGTVKESITMADASTQTSAYQNFRFSNCYARGGLDADRCVWIAVTDGDSWWNASRQLRNIQFIGGQISQAADVGLEIFGAATAPSDTYVEARNVNVFGVHFEDNNNDGNTGSNGCAITAIAHSIKISGCTFGNDSSNGYDFVVLTVTSDSGEDPPTPSSLISDNDFSEAVTYAVEPARSTQSGINSATLFSNNLNPGVGREVYQTYKVQTTGATATTIFSYVASAGQSGVIEAIVVGSTSDGADTISSRLSAHFRRDGSATTLSTPVVDVHDPDTAFATDPTIDLSTNTIRVRIVGIAATTIDWSARVTMLVSR